MSDALKIGLFSLRDGAGVTSLTIHIANYMAGGMAVAVVEKISGQRESEYKDINIRRDEDGTYLINNVCFYPADVEIMPTEAVVITDIGAINAAYKFDEYDKLYLCTDTKDDRIDEILQFKADTGIEFDVVVFGGSRNILPEYSRAGLKALIIGNKKEERLDYNFYLSFSQFLRIKGMIPPEYQKDWSYYPVEFTGFIDPLLDAELKKKSKKRETQVKKEEPEIEVPLESSLNTKAVSFRAESNIFGDFSFIDIPEPDAFIPEPEIEDDDKQLFNEPEMENELDEAKITEILESQEEERKKELAETNEKPNFMSKNVSTIRVNEEKDLRIAENKPEMDELIAMQEALANKERLLREKDEYLMQKEAELSEKTAAFFEAKNNSQQLEQKNPRYVYKPVAVSANDHSVLARAIGLLNKEHETCCNVFLVTKTDNLFIFSNVATFVNKLSVLKREIRNVDNIHYIMISRKDASKRAEIITDDKKLTDVYSLLGSLDNDLRLNPYFTDNDIRAHRELLFNEILYCE